MSSEADPSATTLGEFVGGEDMTLRNLENYGDLNQAIEYLEPRERMIIVYRFFRGHVPSRCGGPSQYFADARFASAKPGASELEAHDA